MQQNFFTKNSLFKKVPPEGELLCQNRVTDQITPTAHFEDFGRSVGCYEFSEIGESRTPQACTERWESVNGIYHLTSVGCEGLVEIEVLINPPVFVVTRTYAYADNDAVRDSLVLDVGKCSFVN